MTWGTTLGTTLGMRRAWLTAAAILLGSAGLPPHLAGVGLSRADLPWWRARLAHKEAEIRAAPRVDLVWYGDSITQDWERTGPAPWGDFAPVWHHYYDGRHALDLGFNGDATSHLLWRIQNGEASGIHPRAAVVLIGANNFGHLHWGAGPTEAGIATIVSELHRRLPGVRVLLIGVLPSIRGAWVDRNTTALNHALAMRYRDGREATFMDLSGLFMAAGRVDAARFLDTRLVPPAPPLHPDAAAQAQIAAAIEPALSAMLGDRPRPPM